MYAVIETGGKQHRVTVGQQLQVEKIEAEAGASVTFDKVLLVGEGESVAVGQPYVKSAKVSAKIIEQGRGKKINIIKFKRRKHHMKRQGHQQLLTKLEIIDISA